MIYSSRSLAHLQKALTVAPEMFDAAMNRAQQSAHREAIHIRRFWIVALVLTIVPGVVGAGMLMVAFVRALISG